MIVSSLLVIFLSLVVQGLGSIPGNTEEEPLNGSKTRLRSDDPIFTVNSAEPFSNNGDIGDDKKQIVKLADRKGSSKRLVAPDNIYSPSNMVHLREDVFKSIYKPFLPKNDSNKLKKSTSWVKKILPRSFSFTSKPPKSEEDALNDQMLDAYKGKKRDELQLEYDRVHLSYGQIILHNEIQLSVMPEMSVKDFALCLEAEARERDDGLSPSCSLACLHYRIKNSIFMVKPQGLCDTMTMNDLDHSPTIVDTPCICDDGLLKKKFRVKIVQRDGVLYSVYSKTNNLLIPLGTAVEIYDSVEDNFRQYLKEFLKKERDIPWNDMYNYVLTLKWIRHPKDDRTSSKYLSDFLRDQIYDIQSFWYTLPERLFELGYYQF